MNKTSFYLKLFFLLLSILGIRLWLIANFATSVPISDQWTAEGRDLFIPYLNGNFNLGSLISAHNEHRVFFTKLSSLLLFMLNESQWDPMVEIVFNVFLSMTNFVITVFILKNIFINYSNNIILFTTWLLWLNPYATDTILIGFYSHWYWMILLTLGALYGFLLGTTFSLRWVFGLFCGIAVCFSMASGFLILVAILILNSYLAIIDSRIRKNYFVTIILCLLLISLGISLLVEIPRHDSLRAHDFLSFIFKFFQSLAWPWNDFAWLGIVMYLPLLILTGKIIWLKQKPNNPELFLLGLGIWVILQVLSLSYGRGNTSGIPSRYMDVLSFGTLVNFWAILILYRDEYFKNLASLVYSFSYIWKGLWIFGMTVMLTQFTILPLLQFFASENPNYLRKVRELIITQDKNNFRTSQIIPSEWGIAADIILNPKLQVILPASLRIEKHLSIKPEQLNGTAFTVNGIVPTVGKYLGEDVIGSYHPQQGVTATGTLVTETIVIAQTYMEIPISGYLGIEGTQLAILVTGQQPMIIKPVSLIGNSWSSIRVAVPSEPFRLQATDLRPDAWFAFAIPKGIGRLSFAVEQLLSVSLLILIISIAGLLYMLSCDSCLMPKEE